MVAAILFSIGAATLLWAMGTGIFVTSNIEGMELALNIAQGEIEEIKEMTYDAIEAAGDSGPTADPNFSSYDVTINIAEGADPMQVDVTVSWDVKGGENSVTLTTLVADI